MVMQHFKAERRVAGARKKLRLSPRNSPIFEPDRCKSNFVPYSSLVVNILTRFDCLVRRAIHDSNVIKDLLDRVQVLLKELTSLLVSKNETTEPTLSFSNTRPLVKGSLPGDNIVKLMLSYTENDGKPDNNNQ
jgi:hypothetical protein